MFCKKLRACKDSQINKDFNVVARVEALIAGWGHEEAIRRAEAYRLAGADAILIHSKLNNVSEIQKFLEVIKSPVFQKHLIFLSHFPQLILLGMELTSPCCDCADYVLLNPY